MQNYTTSSFVGNTIAFSVCHKPFKYIGLPNDSFHRFPGLERFLMCA
jgi:hypothetical protein